MILTGLCRLGRDAELRYMPDGTAVLKLALAYNYGKKDAQGNRSTQWVDASLFGDRATSLQPYLLKGQQINAYIDEIHIAEFKHKDGSSGSSLRGRISSLEFASGTRPPQQGATTTQTTAPAAGQPPYDDDIPF